jgi:hypothetical protein
MMFRMRTETGTQFIISIVYNKRTQESPAEVIWASDTNSKILVLDLGLNPKPFALATDTLPLALSV